MGYRSEVAYSIHFENVEVLDEFIAKVMVLGGFELEALQECEIEERQGKDSPWYAINYYAPDYKWYDDYDEVKGHEHLMELALEWYPEQTAYHFIRVGEENGDVDDRSDGEWDDYIYDDFYPTQGMEIPFSASYESIGEKLRVGMFTEKQEVSNT